MAKLDYYAHSTFGLTTDDGTRVIIDPRDSQPTRPGYFSTSVRGSVCTMPGTRRSRWTCSSCGGKSTWLFFIEQDAEAFKSLVGDRARVEILEPGKGSYEF